MFAEKLIKGIVESGANTVVAGGSISEICLHYMNKYGLLVLSHIVFNLIFLTF